jgi:proteasome accessory factor A
VRYDRAAEEIIRESMVAAAGHLPDGAEILCHKNNSDGKGNSYGCHENYLLARSVPFGRIVSQVTPHFVTRQIVIGAGKVGCELPGMSADDVPYQISQRADFFEEEVGLETTLKRPIVNTRDEPHCDASEYRRLHVIVGDANMSEVATYLKVGTTAIVLAMIEDDELGDDWLLANPVGAIRQVSHDPTLQRTVLLRNGRRATALEVQWGMLERARKYERSHGLIVVGESVGSDVLARWEAVLTGLETDRGSVADVVDWVAKQRLIEGYAERHDLEVTDARLKALDLQYHDLRPEKCLAHRVGLQTIIDPPDVETAKTEPPTTTRAYFRGRCLAKWPADIVAANWDSLVFDIGRDPLRRVPMMEPLRGTAEHVARLIDESNTPAELLARLGA